MPVARLSGGQRQAIAVARTISGDADIILLDEPLAAMGAKEGAMILDLIQRLKDEGNVAIIMILHNYVHVLTACDRVNLIQDGVIALDKPTAETSVEELTEIVVEEYRRARAEALGGNGAAAAEAGARRQRRPGAGSGHRGDGRAVGPESRTRVLIRVTERPAVSERACSIGVDFGTESGRALVLDARTGEELAVSVVPYASAVIDCELPVDAASGCRPTGRCRIPTTGWPCSSAAYPRSCRGPASARPGRRDRRSTSPRARSCRWPPTASRCVSASAGASAATRGRSCGSTTPPSPSPTGSTRSRSSAARSS